MEVLTFNPSLGINGRRNRPWKFSNEIWECDLLKLSLITFYTPTTNRKCAFVIGIDAK